MFIQDIFFFHEHPYVSISSPLPIALGATTLIDSS